MLIPKDVALAAASDFYRTGTRPTIVSWREL
jgi:hypothetical protein